MCSPVVSGKDQSDVSEKLDAWKKDNCPQTVQVRNGTVGYYAGCSIKSFGAQNLTTNTKSDADRKIDDVEFCSGAQGANYGVVKCN